VSFDSILILFGQAPHDGGDAAAFPDRARAVARSTEADLVIRDVADD